MSASSLRASRALEWARINLPFLVVYSLAAAVLSLTFGRFASPIANLLSGLVTAGLAPYVGFLIHMLAHKIDYMRTIYDRFESDTNPVLRTALYWLSWYLDFHDDVHHCPEQSRRWYNVLFEAVQNFQFQALLLLCVNTAIGRPLNNHVVVMWGLFYVTIHLVNFSVYKHKTHELHHTNRFTNYEPYIFDILHNTTFDDDAVMESWNTTAINVVVVSALIVLVKKTLCV